MAELYALCAATAVLVLIPGPNVALIVASSLRYGVRAGVVTVLGTTTGLLLQVCLVLVGLAVVIEFAAAAFGVIRWAGVAYLVWLGIRTWRAAQGEPATDQALPRQFWRACLLAAVNPKTLLFNAAFLPQFLPAPPAPAGSLVLVGAVFLGVVLLGDLLWAACAASARPLLERHVRTRNRISGAFLVVAGIGLALSRRWN